MKNPVTLVTPGSSTKEIKGLRTCASCSIRISCHRQDPPDIDPLHTIQRHTNPGRGLFPPLQLDHHRRYRVGIGGLHIGKVPPEALRPDLGIAHPIAPHDSLPQGRILPAI